MILPDIQILVYAHRKENPYHEKAAQHLLQMAQSLSPFALCSFVCSGFLRLVTNHRIFVEPTSLDTAMLFIESLLQLEHCRVLEPGPRHWPIFSTLLKEARATGNLVSDAYLASIAIEHGCELLTHDRDFLKFPELKVLEF